MKASLLGLFGVMIGAAAWGCSGAGEGAAVGGGGRNALAGFGDDLRVDPPPGKDFEASGAGAAGLTASGTTTANSGGSGLAADPPDCEYAPIGDIHLSLPSARPLGSAPLARGFVGAAQAPDASRVHPREFLNYYQVQYPAAAQDVAVVAELTQGGDAREMVLQVGVQAPASAGPHRRVALVVVVDTSLSMAGESMSRAREAAASLARALGAGDSFTLVTSSLTGAYATVDFGATGDLERAVAAAEGLEADGGDQLGAALADAYLIAANKRVGEGIARVVLITDGAARPDAIDLGIVAGNKQLADIPLIGVGVGEALSYQSDLIDIATRAGGGASIYLDSAAEAKRALLDRFDQIMDVWADDVEVVLTLPPYVRIKGVQDVGFAESPTGLSHAPLPLGRSLVFRQALESCVSASTLPATTYIGVRARWKLRDQALFTESTEVGGFVGQLGLGASPSPQVVKASLVTAYAEALASVRTARLQAIHDEIVKLQLDPATPIELVMDEDLAEIADLAQQFVDAAK